MGLHKVFLFIGIMVLGLATVPAGAAVGLLDPARSAPVEEVLRTIPQAQAYWQECYAKCHRNHECNAVACANSCKGQVIKKAYDVAQIGKIMDYNVKAAYAATCIDKFRDYIKTIQDAAKNAQNLGLSPATMIVQMIVDQVLDAIMQQIFNSLTNSICNVTNEALGAIDSFARNAICLPSLSLGNPLDFNLDLGRMQCNGWSVNMLNGNINGQIVEGVPNPNMNSNNFNSGAVPTPTLLNPPTSIAPPVTLDPTTLVPALPDLSAGGQTP